MKVMQICFAPIVNSAGGAEKVYCNMSNHFVEKHEVLDVCCDDKRGLPFYFLDKKIKFVNLGEHCDLRVPLKVKIHNEIVRLFKKIGCSVEWPKEKYIRKQVNDSLKSLLDKEKPDVVICYELRSMVAVAECGFPLSKMVVMIHTNVEGVLNSLSSKQAEILHNVSNIQVCLESYRKILFDKSYTNSVCIGNVVPQYDVVNEVLKENLIVHIGRLDQKVKRQHLLIEAFAQIANKYPSWTIKFFGGDSKPKEYECNLRNLIIKNNLESKVFLMGKTNDVEIELRKASIFVFPSVHEGFGLALAEAMSIGIPSIGFKNTSAVNELIQNGSNGILCDESIDALANALEELIVNESERIRYGKQAREDMKKYSADKIYAEWDCLIEKVLQEDQ